MAASLLFTLFLSAIDPLWAGEHLTFLAVFDWARQAALVLGAALIAAATVVSRLTPAAPRHASRPEPASDWFA